MTVTLLMAISINGYIAGPNDDTDWVKDLDFLYKTVAEYGVVVMGRRTYQECVKYDAFPYKGALNIVMTHDPKLLKKTEDQVIFTDQSPTEVAKMVEAKGSKKLLLIGGGHLNGSFLKDSLIDEMILDVHPLVLPGGVRLFEGNIPSQNLTLMETKPADQFVTFRYQIK